MATLFTPECTKSRGYALTGSPLGVTGAVAFQGDAGYGVMTEAKHARNERAAQQRAGLHAAHGRGAES